MVLVVGIGNRDRGDDGIGSLIAERLIKEGWENVLDCERTPENYLSKIVEKKPKKIIFIDACDFDGEIGEIRIFKKEEWQNFKKLSLSTHTLPIPLFLSLIEKLTNSEIYLLGIQVKNTNFSQSLSKELNNLFAEIINKVKTIIKGG
ncbi:MAG: hydrogenase 3 maturation endopeptidase HyCI [candidate division WOR-3 bacterium]|nr:hydrogenase 3 maturation endopeptidase HyCI [candidate division WOR-3 bacterium]